MIARLFGREPAMIVAGIAGVVQGIYLLVTGEDLDRAALEVWLLPVVTILAGWLTRQQVMPVKTITDAGFTPQAIKTRALDPHDSQPR